MGLFNKWCWGGRRLSENNGFNRISLPQKNTDKGVGSGQLQLQSPTGGNKQG